MTLSERFQSKVHVQQSGCWEWMGSRAPNGYGRIMVKAWSRSPQYAHRIAWFLATGSMPDKQVLHRCDNPACVNVAHLFIGDQRDNAIDMMRKGRGRGQYATLVGPLRPKRRYYVSITCAGCGAEVEKRKDHAARSARNYCSRECAGRFAHAC